ncbi:MAG: glyoxalase/bleomycin resistance/dioxygenase family protein [Acidobacteria bacterium]|nr:MAG: glyoxalase/bleomycin resistance/dioxygenase family protein [Acidobacteriota bacterium]
MESKNNSAARAPVVSALKAHLALNVKNVAQSIQFYRQLFDTEPSKVRPGYAKFDVHNPPLNFTLNEAPVSTRGAQKWSEAGLLTRDEMQTSCCYAVQDKTWVRDPDGNEWEVFVVLEDNLAETAPCECGDKIAEAAPDAINETGTSCCAAAPAEIAR